MKLPWRHVQLPSPALGPPVYTSLTRDEALTLRELSSNKMVLEIGAAYGYSSIVTAGEARHVFSIDPHRGYGAMHNSLAVMRDNLWTHGVEKKVTIVLGTSQTVLPQLISTGAKFDLIFIDGDHTREAVACDMEWSRGLLRGDGILLCHDYGEDTCPGVREHLDTLNGSVLVDTLWGCQPWE